MDLLILGGASFISWFLSLLTGGGSPFVLIPLVSLLLGAEAVAPVITTGMLVGNIQRGVLFWEAVDWSVTFWYLPGAIVGAVLGAYAFTQFHAEWLQLLLGAFLLLMVLNSWLRIQPIAIQTQPWHFLPYAFLNAVGSGLIGSTGPVLNPVYLNYGLVKEELIATKALHQMILHVVKLGVYGLLGVYSREFLGYGLLIGLAGLPANYLAKGILEQMSPQHFRQAVFIVVGLSGLMMIWGQRASLPF